MNAKELHAKAVRIAKRYSDETDVLIQWHEEHKLWTVFDTTEGDIELATDAKLIADFESLEEGVL